MKVVSLLCIYAYIMVSAAIAYLGYKESWAFYVILPLPLGMLLFEIIPTTIRGWNEP